MAKQKGIIKLEGTIGGITFHKSKDGYIAKEKSGVPAERIASDPAFQRTRENNAEFARAGKAGKLLRQALRTPLQLASDSRMIGRLTREMLRVVQADTTSERGLRNVMDGAVGLLEGFDFNINGRLGTTLFAPYTATLNRVSGQARISLPPFVPVNMVAAPGGTTHFNIMAAAAAIDFAGGNTDVSVQESGLLPWGAAATEALDLTATLPANSPHPLFLALGVAFVQEVNGNPYALKNGAFNALTLVKVLEA